MTLHTSVIPVKDAFQNAVKNLPDGYMYDPTVVVRTARRVARGQTENPVTVQVAGYGTVTLSGEDWEHYAFEPTRGYAMYAGLPNGIDGVGLP